MMADEISARAERPAAWSKPVPTAVRLARDTEEQARSDTENAWERYLDAKPLNVVPLRSGWLDAVTPLGVCDRCPSCGFTIPVCDLRSGWHLRECSDCRLAWETRADG